jgi:hypothetical protein
MLRRVIAAMSLLLLAALPLAAEECGWLSTKEVDAALPAFAPWSVMVGGAAGSCKFLGNGPGANVFGANQMIKADAAQAAKFVRGMRPEMEKSYTVAAAKELGAEAFTYRPKDDPLDDRSIFFVAHEGRIAVIGSLTLAVPVTAEHIAGATKLLRVALAIDKNPAAMAAATECPWFVTSILKKLLPGEGFNQQRFGNNSCLAQAAGSAVTLTIVAAQDPAQIMGFGSGGCTGEPVAALGPEAKVWSCEGGRPHAKVSYVSGNRLVEYAFSPAKERAPTAAERALLIELATKAPARAAD